MPHPCPKCNSRKTASIKATKRLALCAEAVNILILCRLKSCYPSVPKCPTYLALERLSQNLVEALATSVQLKLREVAATETHTHVCLRCGGIFDPATRHIVDT